MSKIGAPHKKEIDYYRLYPQKKLRRTIIVKHEHKGHTMFIDLVTYIIKSDGYFFKYTEEDINDFLADHSYTSQDKKLFEDLVKTLLHSSSTNFFHAEYFRKYKILTNYDLQEGYIKATKRRISLVMVLNYLLPQMEDTLSVCRNPDMNDIRKYQIGKSTLWQIEWIRMDKKDMERRKEAEKTGIEQKNYWELAGLELPKKNNGMSVLKIDTHQVIDNETKEVLNVDINSLNVHTTSTLTPTSKVKLSEAKQSDSFANSSEFASSKDDTTLGKPSADMSSDNFSKTNKKQAGTSAFVLAVRSYHEKWTGIPFVNDRDDNAAIKKIANTIEFTIRKQHEPAILDDEQVLVSFNVICQTIFNEKNWQKLPNYLHDVREFTTIAKNLKTIIHKIYPIPKKNVANYAQNVPKSPQNQAQDVSFLEENRNRNFYTTENISKMNAQELNQHYQLALQNNKKILADILLNELEQRQGGKTNANKNDLQNKPVKASEDTARSGRTQSISELLPRQGKTAPE